MLALGHGRGWRRGKKQKKQKLCILMKTPIVYNEKLVLNLKQDGKLIKNILLEIMQAGLIKVSLELHVPDWRKKN